jgi:hypothetical protein
MSQVTYEEVNLMLKLYEMRREPRLRQARAWFLEHFHPLSPEDMMQKYPQGGEENTFIRMVISYWDMVASIVNRGLINDELFFESNGRIWVVGIACTIVHLAGCSESAAVFKHRGDTCEAAGSLAREESAGIKCPMRQMMGEAKPKSTGA